MAITLNQYPNNVWLHARRNPIIVAATSSNVANTGFRYVIELECAGQTNTFLYAPNASNALIADLQPLLRSYLGPRLAGESGQFSIHELGSGTANLHLNELATTNATKPVQHFTATIKEGWIIAGVFTPTAVGQASFSSVIQNISLPSARHEHTYGVSTNHTTDRTIYTGYNEFDLADTYGLAKLSTDIFIPTSNNDKGILSFITDDGTYLGSNGKSSFVIRGVMVESDGTTTTKEITIAGVAGQITHFGCYPYNLNTSSIGASFFDTNSYPDYRYYTISLHDNTNPAKPQMGNRYVFFDMQYQCKYDLASYEVVPNLVRVTWLNDQGFWDYFNFNYKSEYTQKVERKTMQKILGSFTGTTYSANQYDRGLAHTSVNAERVITMTSKKLDTDEFRLMSSLLRSTDVYLLTDIGGDFYTSSIIPVVIETADNIEHRPLDSKARDITIIAREAHSVI